jgi:hypothetical protein
MVDTLTAGETTPNSSWGGSGLSGMKSLGSKEVGLMVSEILVPAVVKNLLNSLAMEVLLVMLQPSTVIESIFELELLVLIASLRRSQVFWDFLCGLLNCSRNRAFTTAKDRVVKVTVSFVGGYIKRIRIG